MRNLFLLAVLFCGCQESDAPAEEVEAAAMVKPTWIVSPGAASVIYAEPPWWVHSCQPVGDNGVEECVDISDEVGSYDGRLCRSSGWTQEVIDCALGSPGDARLVVTTFE